MATYKVDTHTLTISMGCDCCHTTENEITVRDADGNVVHYDGNTLWCIGSFEEAVAYLNAYFIPGVHYEEAEGSTYA